VGARGCVAKIVSQPLRSGIVDVLKCDYIRPRPKQGRTNGEIHATSVKSRTRNNSRGPYGCSVQPNAYGVVSGQGHISRRHHAPGRKSKGIAVIQTCNLTGRAGIGPGGIRPNPITGATSHEHAGCDPFISNNVRWRNYYCGHPSSTLKIIRTIPRVGTPIRRRQGITDGRSRNLALADEH
jgi:hypothetical protein